MILKYSIRILLFFGFLYGIWYSFEFINPWIAIIAGILITAFIIDKIIKNYKLKLTNKTIMKKLFTFLTIISITLLTTSCSWVKPNYAGILMQNYGKNGKSDFTIVTGKVWTAAPGTELFQTPLFDQRGEFVDSLHLKAADNTQFTARPSYSFKVIKDRAIDVVFDNKHLDESGDDFVQSLEDNILEPRIYDLIKEESRKYKTDELMADGGSLLFEKK